MTDCQPHVNMVATRTLRTATNVAVPTAGAAYTATRLRHQLVVSIFRIIFSTTVSFPVIHCRLVAQRLDG